MGEYEEFDDDDDEPIPELIAAFERAGAALWRPSNLREALEDVERRGIVGHATKEMILRAARGLLDLYDNHRLYGISPDSAADQCATLYELLNSVGLEVA